MTRPVLDLDVQKQQPGTARAASVARLLRRVAALLVAAASALDRKGRPRRRHRGALIDLGSLDAAARGHEPADLMNPPGWTPIDPAALSAMLAGECAPMPPDRKECSPCARPIDRTRRPPPLTRRRPETFSLARPRPSRLPTPAAERGPSCSTRERSPP